MNVAPISVTQGQAFVALREYKQHRNIYDARDWEIERVYRAISKGKVVISVRDAIRRAGVDEQGLPRLAICRADYTVVRCDRWSSGEVTFRPAEYRGRASDRKIVVPWPDRPNGAMRLNDGVALVPRIPPQHRPAQKDLSKYHILWEADWKEIPRDPYLLRRIGKDAWVVLAAWDLTEVELSVLRAHQQ